MEEPPERPPRREFVAFRLSKPALDYIDQLAKQRGISRSEMIRVLLTYASQRMPKGWKP